MDYFQREAIHMSFSYGTLVLLLATSLHCPLDSLSGEITG
ncbi:hypothetical protein LINPERPRIM_LOCUS2337 [Linum perenne]